MTLEEFKTLAPGDTVYRVFPRNWETNATLQGRPVFLHKVQIHKVNKKTVSADGYPGMMADDLLTIAVGDEAIRKETEKRERAAALDRRWAEARLRVQVAVRASKIPAVNQHQQYISFDSTDIDAVEHLATLLELGEQALLLQGAISQRLSVDSPMVHLHLSTRQAAQVLALLEEHGPSAELMAPRVDKAGPA